MTELNSHFRSLQSMWFFSHRQLSVTTSSHYMTVWFEKSSFAITVCDFLKLAVDLNIYNLPPESWTFPLNNFAMIKYDNNKKNIKRHSLWFWQKIFSYLCTTAYQTTPLPSVLVDCTFKDKDSVLLLSTLEYAECLSRRLSMQNDNINSGYVSERQTHKLESIKICNVCSIHLLRGYVAINESGRLRFFKLIKRQRFIVIH